MSTGLRSALRWTLIGACALCYALLAHFSTSAPGARSLGLALAVAPLLLFAVALAWRATHRTLGLAACVLGTAAVWAARDVLQQHVAWLYLIQQAVINLLLAAAFGQTLGRGRIPLCTRWATLVHGPLAPEVALYTRRVTLAWAVFFVTLTVVLCVMFWLAPLPLWSAFANFCTLPLVAAMFLGEYLLRQRVLPQVNHEGILANLRVYRSGSRDPAPAPPG
jgi:uncharacterized membrane protein